VKKTTVKMVRETNPDALVLGRSSAFANLA
jgi:hypothetical protein